MATESSSIPSSSAATTTAILPPSNAAIATTTATTAPVTSTSPQFIQRRPFIPSPQPQNLVSSSPSAPPQILPQTQIRYPVASSGRGFVSSAPRPHVLLSNPNPNQARSNMGYPPPPRPFGFAPSPPPLKGFPVSANPHHFKVGPSVCSLPDCIGGHKVTSENVREDVCVVVRDRKVRISNGASVYSLCRSWLRNGHPEDSQPHFTDVVKSLPRPAPLSESSSPKRKRSDEEEENDLDMKAAESLSSEELLQLHIKRAKRVRERLREERGQRIKRYRSRISLLLRPWVEQCPNDPSDGS